MNGTVSYISVNAPGPDVIVAVVCEDGFTHAALGVGVLASDIGVEGVVGVESVVCGNGVVRKESFNTRRPVRCRGRSQSGEGAGGNECGEKHLSREGMKYAQRVVLSKRLTGNECMEEKECGQRKLVE